MHFQPMPTRQKSYPGINSQNILLNYLLPCLNTWSNFLPFIEAPSPQTHQVITCETDIEGLLVICGRTRASSQHKLLASSCRTPELPTLSCAPGGHPCMRSHRAPTCHSNLESRKQLGGIKVLKCQGLSLSSPPTLRLGKGTRCLDVPRGQDARVTLLPGIAA